MVKFSDLLVAKSLHRLARYNLVASLIFMTSCTTYSLAMLTIDSVMSFLHLSMFKTYINERFSSNRVTGNSNALYKMAESF